MGDQLKLAVFVTTWGAPSETFVRRELRAAVDAGNRVTVASMRPPVRVDPADGLEIFHPQLSDLLLGVLRTSCRRPLAVSRVLIRILRNSSLRNMARHIGAAVFGLAVADKLDDADVAHAHFAWLAATAADAYASIRQVPLSVFPHAFDVFEPDKVDRYLGDKLNRSALVPVESPTMAAYLRDRFGCEPTVTRIGIPRAWVASEPHVGSRAPGHAALVLSVGMLREKKGHDLLIRAVSELPDTRLDIVGEGPARRSLERLVTELRVDDRVALHGLLAPEDILDRLDAADVFALASRQSSSGDWDGVPNVLIEALGRGVPAVSTSVSGIPDLLAPDRGLLVPPDDVEALRHAIGTLIDDRNTAWGVASAGLEHVRSCYVLEDNWKVLEGRLRSIVEDVSEDGGR